MRQSFVSKPSGLRFTQFRYLSQETLLDFVLHLHTVELFLLFQFITTSRGE